MSTRYDVQQSARGRRLKKGTRDLIAVLGGSSDAAKAIRQPKRQARLSHYSLPNTDAFAPIDVVVELEDAAAGAPGAPFAVRAMAYELGFELFKLPDLAAIDHVDWAKHLACVGKEAGDVMGRLGAALADSKFSKSERKALIPETRELVTAAVQLLAMLEASEEM